MSPGTDGNQAVTHREWTALCVQIAELRATVLTKFEGIAQHFEHVNGYIEQAREMAEHVASKEALGDVERRLDSLEQQRSSVEGKEKGGETMRAIIMLIIGAVISYLVFKFTSAP